MLRELIQSANPSVTFSEMPLEIVNLLSERKVPEWLLAELKASASTEFPMINQLVFFDPEKFRDYVVEEPWNSFFNAGFLCMAYGYTGDPIAVELATGNIVYIHHDELFEYFTESGVKKKPDVRTRMVATKMHFNDFWVAAAADEHIPNDAYEAEERWKRYVVPKK